MGASAYAEKAMLDWVLGGATPTRPAAHGFGLSLGTPTTASGSEMSVSAYARKTILFAPATAGVASNSAAVLFTVSSACTIKGWQLWDTVLSANSGSMLAQGLLSASSVMVAGDILSFSVGAVTINLG